MLDIHDDSGSLAVLSKQDPVGEELEAIKGPVPTADQALWFVGPDLEDQVPVTKLFLDVGNKSEVAEDGIQNFAGCLVHDS